MLGGPTNSTKLDKQELFYWLYVLALEDDHIYVGITSRRNPSLRIEEHIDNEGSKWTKIHKYKDLESIQPLGYISESLARTVEQRKTKEYMSYYGHNKVRGGYTCYTGTYNVEPNGYMRRDNDYSRSKY